MTDAKSRKVIILESTFMPTHIKDAIAQALFENLRVSSGRVCRGALKLMTGPLGVIHAV
jgi:hypothetical protein